MLSNLQTMKGKHLDFTGTKGKDKGYSERLLEKLTGLSLGTARTRVNRGKLKHFA